MSMRFTVELVVDVDVDQWAKANEIRVPAALKEVLSDLRNPDLYLATRSHLARVVAVKAQLALFNERQLDAITQALAE